MLKGISPLLSPELLKRLAEMGHGDRLTLADAHFPGHSLGPPSIRADGVCIAPLLRAVLELVQLDNVGHPLMMMQVDSPAVPDPQIEADYMEAVRTSQPGVPAPLHLPRAAFYDAARAGFVIVVTGDMRPYGNILITKGVTPA